MLDEARNRMIATEFDVPHAFNTFLLVCHSCAVGRRLRACLDNPKNSFFTPKQSFETIPPKHSKKLEKLFCIPNLIFKSKSKNYFFFTFHTQKLLPMSHYPSHPKLPLII